MKKVALGFALFSMFCCKPLLAKDYCFNQAAQAAQDAIELNLRFGYPKKKFSLHITTIYGSGKYIPGGSIKDILVATNEYLVEGTAYVGGMKKGAIVKPLRVTVWANEGTCKLLRAKVEYGADSILD